MRRFSPSVRRAAAIGWTIACLGSGVAAAQPRFTSPMPENPASPNSPTSPSPAKDVGFDQKLGGQVPLDVTFRDEAGRAVPLRELFGRRPVVLSLVYFECPMLCTLASEGLVRSLKALAFTPGKEFDVLTVSFEPKETPELAAMKKRNTLALYGRAVAPESWRFLTGDADAIKRLTEAVGFRYVWDESSRQWAHATGVVVLTPQGKIARYFFGIEYAAKDLRLGLIEAAEERIGSLVDSLLLLCYHYDPRVGKYGLMTLNLMRGAGVATVLGLAALVFTFLRRERKAPMERHA